MEALTVPPAQVCRIFLLLWRNQMKKCWRHHQEKGFYREKGKKKKKDLYNIMRCE